MPHTPTSPAIYYETSGNPADTPVVLVSGMTAQMLVWRDGFVDCLVKRGMFVIRLDNRDVGLSGQTGGPDDLTQKYKVDDMGDDVCRVLDALGLESAHVVGESLGGAIAQAMAINTPERVRSAVLFYTSPSFEPRFLTDEILSLFATPPSFEPTAREAELERFIEDRRRCGSPVYPFDEAWAAEFGARCYDRCHRPDGWARQMMAAVSSGDRSGALPNVAIPTAVIHGRHDRLVKPEASLEIARLIPNSELHIYPDMGHEVAMELWEEYADIIVRTAAR